jgi:hypothetical protein
MSITCLVPVEDLIRDAERAYDSLVWDNPQIDSSALCGLLNELDYLYSLKAQGVIYEPNF